MPPPTDPVPRARSAFHWLGGVLLLGILVALLTAAATMLWENVDVQRLARGTSGATPLAPPEPAPPAPAAAPDVPFEAALLESPGSASYFPDGTFYPELLERWEGLTERAGGAVRRIATAAEVDALGPETLVLAPAAVCLAEDVGSALRRHLARGGGLVLHWATGARDARCRWVGWDTLRRLTGAIDVLEIPADREPYVAMPAGMPLSAGLAPGARIELRQEPHLALLVTGPRAYWSDWALNPAGATPDADAAAYLRPTADGGRVAWFGFGPAQAATPRDAAKTRAALTNGIRWTAGVPLAEVAPWPEANRSALLISEDVEEAGFADAAALADVLSSAGVRGSFYVVSGLAAEHPSLGRVLAAAGEVGSHTADHAPVGGLPEREQRIRLERSAREVEAWAGATPAGLRPPEERFDVATLRAWSAVGGEYVVAVNNARSAGPELFRTPDGPVVLLPRLIKDDYNVLVQESAVRPGSVRDAYIEGMRKLRTLGGLAVVTVHTQLLGQKDRVDAVAAVIDSARAQGDWWIGTGAEIARWWRARHGLEVAIEPLARAAAEPVAPAAAEPRAPTAGAAVGSATGPAPPAGPARPAAGWDIVVTSATGTVPERSWIDVYLPAEPELVPVAAGIPISYARTGWGLRVPLAPAITDAGGARLRLVPPDDTPAAGSEPAEARAAR